MTDIPATAGPHTAQTHFAAGAAALARFDAAAAATSLARAARLDPHDADTALFHARALAMLQRIAPAISEVERALALAPANAQALDRAGDVYTHCNLHARAADVFHRAVALAPRNAGYRYNLAASLTAHGDADGADREYEACLALDHRHWRAHLALAQLRLQTPGRNHVARLRTLLPVAAAAGITATVFIEMALAKELEDLGDHAAAFRHLVRGKAAPRRAMGYSIERDAAMFDALARAMPVVPTGPPGHASEEPIFIVGMPRSGTTLVDRILSSHPRVQSAGELYAFPVAWKNACGGPRFRMFDPAHIARATALDWAALGRAYVDATRPLTGSHARFTDKLPHNFLLVGQIARALPRARIVCVRRNAMDTCLGNFRLLFAPESPYFGYSHDLLDTGRYYLLFDRLMAHWARLFPGRILHVDYETLVGDQEGSTRRLVEGCGLSWDDACLHFERNAAAVATASATQVRRPLHREGLHRWKRYEAELRPLRRLLEAGGIRVDD